MADIPVLSVSGLHKHFPVHRGFIKRVVGYVDAVNGVDFDIMPGETLGLVGESGCGKTTVARMIVRLLRPDAGHIRFNGEDISALSERRFKPYRRQIQIVFQDPYGSLNPRMTVGETVDEGIRVGGTTDHRQRRERVASLLNTVGLPAGAADRYPHEFSGGQRQRVGIARALSVNPTLIVCDEPVSALDVSIQAQIINLLKDLQDELGLSYLFISHDLNVVSYLCSHVCVMVNGQIVESAPAEDLFDTPRHPYTLKLLGAIQEPFADDTSSADGGAPDSDTAVPSEPPAGCHYRDMCPDHEDRCRREVPPMVTVGDNHQVRCWRGKTVNGQG